MSVLRNNRYRKEDKVLEKIEKQEKLPLFTYSYTIKRLEEEGFIIHNVKNYVLTEKGRYARQLGMKNYLECERVEIEILRFSVEKCKKRGLLIWASFLTLLLLFLIFAAINFDLFLIPGF